MIRALSVIASADGWQIEKLLDAVLCRYAELYPDWEVTTISFCKNRDKNEQIDGIIRVLQAIKEMNAEKEGK